MSRILNNSRIEVQRTCDPACTFDGTEAWTPIRQYRFLPPCHLGGLDVSADHGLESLIYLQTLISDEVEVSAARE
jgi:hypothetical protein